MAKKKHGMGLIMPTPAQFKKFVKDNNGKLVSKLVTDYRTGKKYRVKMWRF